MIALIGTEFFGKRVVAALLKNNVNAMWITTSLRDIYFKNKIKSYLIIHFTGSPTVTLIGIFSLIRFKMWHKKIVVSWIGFDVRRVNTSKLWRFTSKLLQFLIDVNITDDKNMVDQLKKAGIASAVQPIPVYSIYELRDLPVEKRIAVYLPDEKYEDFIFYQGDVIKKLVNAFPDVQFIVTRNHGHYFTESNVKCITWTDNMEEIYEKVRAVIRLPKHDATGATIIETLSMGRIMISSHTDFPYCKIVNNFEDAKKYLKEVIDKPILNIEGSKYVHTMYDNDTLSQQLISIYAKLVQF